MLRYAPFLFGAAAGALYARERRARNRVERLGAATLETLLDAIDANNAVTGAHVRRVADYALILADTFDAVTHARPYSHALSRSRGLEIIGAGRGKQFDPDLVDLFLSPPVMEEVEESMRKSQAPRKAGGKRRAGRHSGNTPDINFRWRRAGPARR